jgi:hypothetical protein
MVQNRELRCGTHVAAKGHTESKSAILKGITKDD